MSQKNVELYSQRVDVKMELVKLTEVTEYQRKNCQEQMKLWEEKNGKR